MQKIELKNYIRNIIYYSNNFVKDSIQFYTSENFYYFNKTMRKIELGAARLSFLIGLMYYNIFRFVFYEGKEHKLMRNAMLYRYVIVNEYNLNNYYMAQKNIICFPSFSSTSFKIGFKTTIPVIINIIYYFI